MLSYYENVDLAKLAASGPGDADPFGFEPLDDDDEAATVPGKAPGSTAASGKAAPGSTKAAPNPCKHLRASRITLPGADVYFGNCSAITILDSASWGFGG